MKCQVLFSGEKEKNIIILFSAEFVQRVVNITKICVSFAPKHISERQFH